MEKEIQTWAYFSSTRKRINNFHKTWIQRYETSTDGFDKFISLYIAFNALYEVITRTLLITKQIDYLDYVNDYSRKEYLRASEIIVMYLDKDTAKLMSNPTILKEIPNIEKIIRDSNYYFDFKPLKDNLLNSISNKILNPTVPAKKILKTINESRDEEYLKDLLSGDSKLSLGALLKLLYKVRCNIFHGNKNYQFEMEQRVKKYSALLFIIYSITYEKWDLQASGFEKPSR